ncbi:hypothetical protein GYMLUDRAFT_250763 [Collybiopsis luxurians FD-317 M1]|uniref:Uncharacterized protein n=1 Tax=Collybiopsis luxurians FD-317 M1 TaxID=944289 RepID=A0A0D0C538_9AGAR|nr:hypothetical protein GYMLUDRAFT_250763 [Collybiopsis luxurians FD-317 M1]
MEFSDVLSESISDSVPMPILAKPRSKIRQGFLSLRLVNLSGDARSSPAPSGVEFAAWVQLATSEQGAFNLVERDLQSACEDSDSWLVFYRKSDLCWETGFTEEEELEEDDVDMDDLAAAIPQMTEGHGAGTVQVSSMWKCTMMKTFAIPPPPQPNHPSRQT